ncbi:hypothetical protein D3C78_1659840 [compost metagenome]
MLQQALLRVGDIVRELLQQGQGGGLFREGEQLLQHGGQQGLVLAALGQRIETLQQGQPAGVALQQVEPARRGLIEGEAADQLVQRRQLALERRIRVFLVQVGLVHLEHPGLTQ